MVHVSQVGFLYTVSGVGVFGTILITVVSQRFSNVSHVTIHNFAVSFAAESAFTPYQALVPTFVIVYPVGLHSTVVTLLVGKISSFTPHIVSHLLTQTMVSGFGVGGTIKIYDVSQRFNTVSHVLIHTFAVSFTLPFGLAVIQPVAVGPVIV